MWNILSVFKARKPSLLEDVMPRTLSKHASQTFVSIPIPPADPRLVFKVKSSWQDRVYLVDIPSQTCTCDDFTKQAHATFAAGDIRRCCRHLLMVYNYERAKKIMAAMPEYNLIPEHVWALIFDGHIAKEIWIKHMFGHPIVFTKSTSDGEWLNVFIRKKKNSDTDFRSGEYERCGFSLVERRWSFKAGPHGASNAVREMIENMGI